MLRGYGDVPNFATDDIARIGTVNRQARQWVDAAAAKLENPDARTRLLADKWFIGPGSSHIPNLVELRGLVIKRLTDHFKQVRDILKSSDVIYSDDPARRHVANSIPPGKAMEAASALKKKDDMNVIYLSSKSAIGQPASLIGKVLNQMMHLNPQVEDFRYGRLAPGAEFPTQKATRNAESLQNFVLDLLGRMPEEESNAALYLRK